MEHPRGKLIVFEGLDRSGKTTQCERLVANLRRDGRTVEHMRFPNRTTAIGQMINAYLSNDSQQEDHVIHLLFSANRWESAQSIRDHIAAGTTVIIDRYYYSGCVYSAAKHNPSLSLSWSREPEVGLPRPDLCIFLDVSAEVQQARGGFGQERYEKRELQDRVRDLFIEMRNHEDERADVVIIDAGRDVDSVEADVTRTVEERCLQIGDASTALRTVRQW